MYVWVSEGKSACEVDLDLVLFPSALSFVLLNRRTTEQRDSFVNVLPNLPSSSSSVYLLLQCRHSQLSFKLTTVAEDARGAKVIKVIRKVVSEVAFPQGKFQFSNSTKGVEEGGL